MYNDGVPSLELTVTHLCGSFLPTIFVTSRRMYSLKCRLAETPGEFICSVSSSDKPGGPGGAGESGIGSNML